MSCLSDSGWLNGKSILLPSSCNPTTNPLTFALICFYPVYFKGHTWASSLVMGSTTQPVREPASCITQYTYFGMIIERLC